MTQITVCVICTTSGGHKTSPSPHIDLPALSDNRMCVRPAFMT